MNFMYRNDDFAFNVDLPYLKEVHGWFEKAKVNHTIAMQGITENRGLIDYIKSTPYWDVQIHCWQHDPYRDMDKEHIYENLKTMVDFGEKELGQRPTRIFPPWGRTGSGPLLEEAAKKLDLVVEPDCAYIEFYLGAIANGEEYFKTAVAETNHFIPYSEWRRVYFHLNNHKEMALVPYLIDVTQEIARGEIDHLDFEKKKDSIEKVKEIIGKLRRHEL